MHENRRNGRKNAKNVAVEHKPNKKSRFTYALDLPVICNINPRSIYNKVKEFETFVTEFSVDLILMSESWERYNFTLDELVKLENYKIISNVHQRLSVGGRPAIFVNESKYDVMNLTNTHINIPWGVEAVWCLLTPKITTNDSKIQKIAVCSFYSKPNSRKKSLLLDHISEAYHWLKTKYPKGLHFVIGADSNDLKLDNILSLDKNFVQMVRKPTRFNPPAILDPVITSLSSYYQEPEILRPLDSDQDQMGSQSDHMIVLVTPINTINNQSARYQRIIRVRPLTTSGLNLFKSWLVDHDWSNVTSAVTVHEKAKIFQDELVRQLEICLPEKELKISSVDQPWFTSKLKKIDRRRRRVYRKERKSIKWQELDKYFKSEMKSAKAQYYQNAVQNLKGKNHRQWYSCLKKLSSLGRNSEDEVKVQEINHLSNKEQAEIIAEQFSKIQNEYSPLETTDIKVPYFSQSEIPQFSVIK